MTLGLQAEFAHVLQVLFVAPGQSMAEIRAFATDRSWLGSEAMWTREAPLRIDARYPAFALLSPEGEIVMAGSATGQELQVRAYLGSLA